METTKIDTNCASPSWVLEVDTVNTHAWWTDAFTKEECEKIIEIGYQHALVDGSVGKNPVKNEYGVDEAVRKSKVAFVQPIPEMHWVYQRLTGLCLELNKQFFNFDLFGFTESLQFTEYKPPGGNYNFHIDRAAGIVARKLSIVLQLTPEEDYVGGDFEIYIGNEPQKLFRKQGTLLVFPSYALHRVTAVTEGTRNSLVGWISGKPFK
jgi:PKHD-type hydroxylase